MHLLTLFRCFLLLADLPATMKLNKIFSDQIPALSEKEEDLLHQVKNTRTTPRDQRFPAHNQALHCWNRYNEWLVCLKQTGGDDEKCQVFRQYAVSICPSDWTNAWDEAREESTFYGVKN
jgi:cytochrome c oxidase subunit 6b